MDRRTLGLMGAITSLAAAGALSAEAAPMSAEPLAQAKSYAELLDPMPNAVERLAFVNSQAEHDGANLIEAQYIAPGLAIHHHHHHHHNNYEARRRYYRHHHRHYDRRHHHHHHHN